MDLDPVARERYIQLINRYIGRDPYLMKMSEFSSETKDLPAIEGIDIANYLVIQTSYFTKQQMKAYKSMEAYNFFVCGWVHNLGTKRLEDGYCLVFARVSLSSFLCVKVLALAVAAMMYTNHGNKHATNLNGDVSPTVKEHKDVNL